MHENIAKSIDKYTNSVYDNNRKEEMRMTWGEFIRYIEGHGCQFKEHDKRHDVYENPATGAEAEIPRHHSKEAPKGTLESIKKKLGVK